MRRIVFRTDEERADPGLFWLRPDEEFFAAGACHVLAGTFLAMYPRAEFSAWSIRPRAPHARGNHTVVAGKDLVFDYAGYRQREAFLPEYVEAMRSHFPDWTCDFDKLDMDPIGWDFCRTRDHRHPTQFPHDPISRATAFIRRFPSPESIHGPQWRSIRENGCHKCRGRQPLQTGWLPLHNAETAELVELLLSHGAPLEARGTDQWTALHLACVSGCVEATAALIKAGADVNSVARSGNTPLHLAAIPGIADTVELLLSAGADTEVLDTHGRTPGAAARAAGRVEIAELIDGAKR